MTIAVITITCIGADQASKFLAAKNLTEGTITSYLFGFLRLQYIENTGAFLGLGSTLSIHSRFGLLVILVGLMLLGILCYLLLNTKQRVTSLIGLSMIFAGGLSNLYDRVNNAGAVVDFLNIGIGTLRTGIFNIADVTILFGLLLLVVSLVKGSSKAKNKANTSPRMVKT